MFLDLTKAVFFFLCILSLFHAAVVAFSCPAARGANACT